MKAQMKKLQEIKESAKSKLDSDKASMKSEVEKISEKASVQVPANSESTDIAQS